MQSYSGGSKVCLQRQAGYIGNEVLNEIIQCDILILKAGRQKRICDKIKECLYNQSPQFLSLGSEIRLAQAMDTVLFLFLSLSQSDNANVKFNICSQMKISLEYHQRGLNYEMFIWACMEGTESLQCCAFSLRIYTSEKFWGNSKIGN